MASKSHPVVLALVRRGIDITIAQNCVDAGLKMADVRQLPGLVKKSSKPLKKSHSEWISMMNYIQKRCGKARSIEILQCVWRGIEITEEGSD